MGRCRVSATDLQGVVMASAMIVDADPLARNLMRVALQRAGYDVRSASSPFAAEEAAPLGSFDVLSIDGTTRPNEAIRTLARLREHGWRGTALYTAERVTDPQLDELTRLLGVRAVFVKPLSLEEISYRLPRLLPLGEGAPRGKDLDVPTGWEGALAAVRAEAAVRLPGEIATLRDLVSRAERGTSPTAFTGLHRLAHTLHGTAGTFRFMVVSEVAGALEAMCEGILSGELSVSDRDTWRRVRSMVDVMSAWLPQGPQALSARDTAAARRGVLLVTDDNALTLRFARLAEQAGVSLVSARGVAEADQAANDTLLDAALVDVELPEDGAVQALASLRRRPALRDLPVAWVAGRQGRRPAAGPEPTVPRDPDATIFGRSIKELQLLRNQRPRRVLLLDDDATFAAAITAMLEPHRIEVTHLPSAVGLTEQLERTRPDLLLVDLLMPFVSGYDVCRDVRANAKWAAVPIVVVTAQTSAQVRLSTYAAGADDFLLKPVVGDELLARVMVQLDRVRRAHERDVSGALRRGAFLDAASGALAAAADRGAPTTGVLVRLSGLRNLNASLGFAAGDAALHGVAETLARVGSEDGLVGRWSGGTFAFLLAGRNATAAATTLARVTSTLQDQVHHTPDGRPFRVTVSVGWASTDRVGTSIEDVFRGAEQHLHREEEKPVLHGVAPRVR